MPKQTHLTLDERGKIAALIDEGLSFNLIGDKLNRHPSTISKEVRKHRVSVESGSFGYPFNPCVHRKECKKRGVCKVCYKQPNPPKCSICGRCRAECGEYEEQVCEKLLKPPYVCGICRDRARCTLRKYEYRPTVAEMQYRETLSDSRTGMAFTPEELERINNIVSPLVKKGQSIHHICVNNADDLMCSERTIYRLLNAGLLDANKMDCPRIVQMRPRKKEVLKKVDRHCYDGRTYDDFQEFISKNPDPPVVQIDSVIGRKGGKVLLTIFFPNCNLMLAFLRDHNTARSVLNVFNDLYDRLGRETYCTLFPVILTDRGSEFSNPVPIECDSDGNPRSRVFYCDPRAPFQKGGIEVAHELIRRILPKNRSFDDLTQADIDLMISHINSYRRERLNDKSPYEVFSCLYGEEILQKLNVRKIEANDIVLSPTLLRK